MCFAADSSKTGRQKPTTPTNTRQPRTKKGVVIPMQWEDYDNDRLTDMVFDSNLSIHEMAVELGRTDIEIKRQMRELDLNWVRRKKGHLSRGQAALTEAMAKLLPGEKIETEAPIGKRLRLDVYCPAYELAAEYHGRQHYMYVEHFHGDKEGFRAAQARDDEKVQLCKDLGIALVVFRYNDDLSETAVYSRMLDAIRNTPMIKEQKDHTYKGNPHYEAYQKRQREFRKEQYRKMKRQQGMRG